MCLGLLLEDTTSFIISLQGLKGGGGVDGCTYFSESHHCCQKVPKWEGLWEHQLVFIGGIVQLWVTAADLGVVCVVRGSSPSELWQPAWNSQLRPQEIPAIWRPYKVTIFIWTVLYRQIISTGSGTEHPAVRLRVLNLLTRPLSYQRAVIAPLPTHFTISAMSFLPYLLLD